MKAVVYEGNKSIVVKDIPTPTLGEQDILVKVEACGICGTDIHIYEGAKGAAATYPPVVLGHEFAGTVVEVGPDVTNVAVGDRVSVDPNNTCGSCYFCRNGMGHFCESMIGYGTNTNGAFAEFCAVHSKQAYKLDANTTFLEGAMTEPVACCLHGIDGCNIKAGNTVLIIGGGMIGLIMLQLAKLAGAAVVILSEPIERRRQLALSVGADLVIDPTTQCVQQVLEESFLKQIDVTIECVGLKQTMEDAIRYAGKNSTAMLFGLGSPDDEISLRPFSVFEREVTIKSSFINPYTQQRALDVIRFGKLKIKELISHTIPLEELEETLKNPQKRNDGKVIVVPQA